MTTCLKSYCMRIYGWKPLTLNHHLDMFGCHRSIASGDIKYLICHVTSENEMIEGPCNFIISESFSWYVTTLPSLVAIDIVAVEMFLVCHKISQDHIIKGFCDYIDRNASRSVTNMTILVAIGTVVVEIW